MPSDTKHEARKEQQASYRYMYMYMYMYSLLLEYRAVELLRSRYSHEYRIHVRILVYFWHIIAR